MPRGPFWVPSDMLTGKFPRKAKEYLQLAEPLDYAKWYRIGINEQSCEGGAPTGDYSSDHPMRPGRYSRIQQLMDQKASEEWSKHLQCHAEDCKAMQTCLSHELEGLVGLRKAKALATGQMEATTSWSKVCSCILSFFGMYVYSASCHDGRSTFDHYMQIGHQSSRHTSQLSYLMPGYITMCLLRWVAGCCAEPGS